ncbi:MAG: saccharopine dehydrogenase family protein [Hyphomicrobium sp.]|uniref:saccharopine dehydrogenase family protein n=1 Tax=Hyphomicrobium sp. TaxID=82 RepID=UPI003D1225A6
MAAPERRFPILVVGATGAFGQRIAELLARGEAIELVVAGRTRDALEAKAAALSTSSGHPVRVAVLDANVATAADVAALGVRLVINASGPYEAGSTTLARAAIAAGCHSIDLADSRAFVAGFGALDEAARAAGVLAVTGASSVPGLSSAVVAALRGGFATVDAIDIAISPGNAFDPGVATVASVLGGVGQPVGMLLDWQWRTVHGWQGLGRGSFGSAGRRWLGYVDVPDLDLFAREDARLGTVRFRAGLEVLPFHLGLWAASWLVRAGLIGSLAPLAPGLLAIKRALARLGSDRGGMFVELRGRDAEGHPKAVRWLLEAGSGHGPYVPALTSVALARRLASGAETRRGAMACFGLVGLDVILAEAAGLDIKCSTHDTAHEP